MAALRAATDAGLRSLLRATADPRPPNSYTTTRDTNQAGDRLRRRGHIGDGLRVDR